MTGTTIIAIDSGRHNSIACVYQRTTRPYSPAPRRSLLTEYQIHHPAPADVRRVRIATVRKDAAVVPPGVLERTVRRAPESHTSAARHRRAKTEEKIVKQSNRKQ